jgi:tritrans,polycis-undecaprenyl-diphosphate synthase [geranylgeranyl-diphosphate specific]
MPGGTFLNTRCVEYFGGRETISRRSSLKSVAGKRIDQLERYALETATGRRILSAIYRSSLYSFFHRHIEEFRVSQIIHGIKQEPLPRHVAIIMDGNRRFAQELGLSSEAGHVMGSKKIEDVLDWCYSLEIPVLTIYAFSTENFKRSTDEVQTLMRLFKDELAKAKQDSRIHQYQVRIRIFGRLEALPDELQQAAHEIMDLTKDYTKYSFNIALAYGGREEIINAIKLIATDVKDGKIDVPEISQDTVSSHLYTNGIPDPDLILRTSGEERVSNFLLWQLAYSELYFSDVYWPAFQKRDFLEAIQTYQTRKRRFGQ